MDRTRSASFVVRLRIEPQSRWRGEVQHVESGERIAFRDEGKLLAFLRQFLDELRDKHGAQSERSRS